MNRLNRKRAATGLASSCIHCNCPLSFIHNPMRHPNPIRHRRPDRRDGTSAPWWFAGWRRCFRPC